MNSGNIHCTHIHVHIGTDLGTAERVEEKYEQWQYTLYSYTCTYRYGPGDSREGLRRSMNSDIHCTHIHVHTGTDLGTAERGGGEV